MHHGHVETAVVEQFDDRRIGQQPLEIGSARLAGGDLHDIRRPVAARHLHDAEPIAADGEPQRLRVDGRPPRRTTLRRANRCGETGSSSPECQSLAKIRRAAMDRAAFAGRQSEELRGPTPTTAPVRWPMEQPKPRLGTAQRAEQRSGRCAPLASASGSGTRLGPIPGREARNSDGSVLIAELRDRGAEHVAHAPHRANQRRAIGTIVKFLAQSRDQRVDRAIEIRPLAPAQHAEKGGARQWLARVAQKRHQEVELRRRQVDPLPSGAR